MSADGAPTAAAALGAWVGAFVDELARAGVRHACVAPGSRSTPLALALARHAGVRLWMHLDERSAAFFALGLARWTGAPVALLCTSGTAAANFLPAVAEARHGRVPLVVLTADRPPELRDVGAAQTIDQTRLFGSHAKWCVEAALPEGTPALLRYARTLAGRAVAAAAAEPAGPVHLNVPFREPLVPTFVDAPSTPSPDGELAASGRDAGAPWVRVTDAAPALDAAAVARHAALLAGARRPVVVAGPQPDPALAAPLARLAARLGAPLLADPLSQLRWGPHDRSAIVDAADVVLRDDPLAAALAPDLVVRVGAVPTSKAVLTWLERHERAPLLVVDAAGWPDPTLRAAEVAHAAPAGWATAVAAALDGSLSPDHGDDGAWLARWTNVNAAARRALDGWMDGLAAPFEGRVLRDAAAALPDGATLWVSSSMPVRDLDAFAAGDGRRLRVLANRGANGIDGVLSSALGAAAAAREAGAGPLALVIGDLAFYHDLNGLLAARLHALDATVVLVNNDGGGIFSFLPQAGPPVSAEHFELLYGTPHGLDFRHASAMYGASHTRLDDPAALGPALAAALARPGLEVLEVRTERARNVAVHREGWEVARGAMAGVGGDRGDRDDRGDRGGSM